jgi:hypothetical protein
MAAKRTKRASGRGPAAGKLLERELRRRGIAFAKGDDDGRWKIEVEGTKIWLSLDNVARDLARDGDPERIVRFVDSALASVVGVGAELPPWKTARRRVYWSAEPASSELGDTLREEVTETVTRVLVIAAPEEKWLTWLGPKSLATWGVARAEVERAAGENLDRLLKGKALEVESARGKKLGMVPVASALKASLVFAPSFKRFVERSLGWPVLAVIPCRDFVYVIAEEDKDLLGAMGTVVQREYRQSGYPITTEVLRLSDDGIEAIGRFPP